MPEIAPILLPTLGVDTRSWVYGNPKGHPIVLVHGYRGDHHGLDLIAKGLANTMPGVAIHVPDLPGFGETPAIPGRTHDLAMYGEWLHAFFNAVAPSGGTILGHSFGSLVVSSSLSQGLRPDHTILINPISAPALEGPKAFLTQLTAAYYRVADMLPERGARALLGNPLIVRGMSQVMAKTRDPELRRWIHGQHDAYFSQFSDSTTLLESFRASVSHTVPEFAGAFTMPTLLIAGEKDDITPTVKQLDLVKHIPGAKLHILPGTGHLVHYEAADEAVGYITDFLRSQGANTAHPEGAGE